MMTISRFRLGIACLVSSAAWLVAGLAVAQEEQGTAAAEVADAEPQVSGEALDGAAGREAAADGGAMDELDLRRTEITGNQELPKVLYIVPWQKSDPGDLLGRPVNTLLDEVLAPLDREEFIRQVDYYSDLEGAKEAL